MTEYDKELQSNTPEFEEARKPLEDETREVDRHGFEERDAPKRNEDDEK